MPRPIQSDGRLHGVVAAIRDERGRFLVIRRAAGVWAGGKVCFPGGAMEVGESQENALARELREELGIEVRPVRCVWTWRSMEAGEAGACEGFVYPIPLTLFGWTAEIVSGTPTANPMEIAECLWMTPEQVMAHSDCLPTNSLFIRAVLDSGANRAGNK